MAGFFSRLFFPSNTPRTETKQEIPGDYPWLEKNPKYGPGFRISQAYADADFGYGAMPAITHYMKLDTTVLETVRQNYSWLSILDKCIAQFKSAEKKQMDAFSDCTGFSDISWWITIKDPAQWLQDMQETIQRLFSEHHAGKENPFKAEKPST